MDDPTTESEYGIEFAYDHNYYWNTKINISQVFIGKDGPQSSGRYSYDNYFNMTLNSSRQIYSRGYIQYRASIRNRGKDSHAYISTSLNFSHIVW